MSVANNSAKSYLGRDYATPLVQVHHSNIVGHLNYPIWVKCEYMGPTGSIYDRMASYGEESVLFNDYKKDIVVNIDNNNFSMLFSVLAAHAGKKGNYRVKCTEKLPKEKVRLLKSIGVKNIIYDEKAVLLQDPFEIFGAVASEAYEDVYKELKKQLSADVSLLAYAGSRSEVEILHAKLIALNPKIHIVGVEVQNERNLARTADNYRDGISSQESGVLMDEKTGVLEWITVSEAEALIMARKLMSQEGLFTALRGGAAVSGLLKYIEKNALSVKSTANVVAILTDAATSGLARELSDEWLIGKGMLPVSAYSLDNNNYFGSQTIKSFLQYFTLMPYLDKRLTVSDCLDLFKKDFNILPIRAGTEIFGVVTKLSLMKSITQTEVTPLSSCTHFINNDFLTVPSEAPISFLQDCLEEQTSVVILNEKEGTTEVYTASLKNIFSLLQEGLKQLL